MSTAFLHGTEVIQQSDSLVAIQTVDTSTIALVCTAPTHRLDSGNRKLNELFLVANPTDASNYIGPEVAGFTGPNAIRAIFDQGGAKVIVVNVFDPATHKTTVTAEHITLAGTPNVATLAHG